MPDPTDPQSLNRYSYVRNNPATRNDPSGRCDDDSFYCLLFNLEVQAGRPWNASSAGGSIRPAGYDIDGSGLGVIVTYEDGSTVTINDPLATRMDPDIFIDAEHNFVSSTGPTTGSGLGGVISNVADKLFDVSRLGVNIGPTILAATWAAGGNLSGDNATSCGFNGDLVLVCTGVPAWMNGPSRHLTVGNTILTESDELTPSQVRHETTHSTQQMIFGPTFLPLYYGSGAVMAPFSDWQWCPPFETAAIEPNSAYAGC